MFIVRGAGIFSSAVGPMSGLGIATTRSRLDVAPRGRAFIEHIDSFINDKRFPLYILITGSAVLQLNIQP